MDDHAVQELALGYDAIRVAVASGLDLQPDGHGLPHFARVHPRLVNEDVKVAVVNLAITVLVEPVEDCSEDLHVLWVEEASNTLVA